MTTQKQPIYRRGRWLAIGVIAIALIAAAAVYFSGRSTQQTAAAASKAETGTIVAAQIGNLSSQATATGNVKIQRAAALSLGQAGTIAKVSVRVGDQVKAGDLLVQLDDTALARDVASAEQSLIIQEANLADLQGSSTSAEVASAQAALDSARANLDKVKAGSNAADVVAARASLSSAQAAYASVLAGPDASTVTQAEATFKNAEAALQQAQSAYDKIASHPDAGMTSQSLTLQQATNNYASAQAAYQSATKGSTVESVQKAKATLETAKASLQNLLDSPTPAELASAEAQVKSAESSLATLQEGATTTKLAAAKAQVEQARLSLQTAQDNLAKAKLIAPFDGVVTAVNVAEDEYASGAAVSLSDPKSMEVVLSVDEVDVGNLAAGQPTAITLEAWPTTEIPGKVISIAPAPKSTTGAIVSYEVHVSLGDTNLEVRDGMTANASIVVSSKNGVLVVPNQAITPDRTAGKDYVNRVLTAPDGAQTTEKVEVTVGLKDDNNTEITSGLQAGDKVLIGTLASSSTTTTGTGTAQAGSSTRRTTGGFGGFFGGGGPPPGRD